MLSVTGNENDLGTFGEDIPFLSRYDVIEFFTDMCSEEDGNRGSGMTSSNCCNNVSSKSSLQFSG